MSIKQIDGYKVYLSKLLGQGTYGAVYQGVNDKTQEKVAIKLLKKANIDADDYLKAALFSEIKILQSVKSPNIVGFEDVMESNQYYYVIQELCDGDLSRIMKPGVCQPEKKAIDMLIHISNGFLALVREGIIHRDLKPANIMTKKGVLKIGDFGFAKKTPNKKVGNRTIVGTPLYMSLQILKGQQYSSKADIWAIGFIFYELLHGDSPWTAKSEFQLVKNIEGKPLKMKQNLQPNTVDFIRKCLALEQKDRISWDQYFLHPIFDGYFDSYAAQNKQFQNKLKTVMSQLRFKVNAQNLDLSKILNDMGYSSQNAEMKFPQFYNFIKTINPDISQQQAIYMFQKTDADNSGTISLKQIQQQMTKHNINLHSTYGVMPIFQRKQSESFSTISSQTESKIRRCFKKIQQVIRKKQVSLYQIFNSFDKDKSGKMNFKEWKNMITKLTKDFTDEQLMAVFNLIDQDSSNTIEFEELNSYFSKVNGIPQFLNSNVFGNHEKMQTQSSSNINSKKEISPSKHPKMDEESDIRNTQSKHGQNQQYQPQLYPQMPGQFPQYPQYPYPQNGYNPYGQSPYYPPTNYPQQGPPIMGNVNQMPYYNPYQQPPPPQYPPNNNFSYMSNSNGGSNNIIDPNQSKGVFGNFIFDKLSQGMKGPNSSNANSGKWN